ncbi:hypothetical protein D3C81_1645370 [compost metagenome]
MHAAAHRREAGVVGFLDTAQVFFQRRIHVQVDDVAARHHQRSQLAVVEAEHVAHHGVLVLLDHARLGAFDQQRVDFFLGHAGAAVGLGAEQAQHQPGGARQQLDEGGGRHREPGDRARHHARNRFGGHLAQALGHQLAQHDGKVGQAGHHDRGGDVAGGGL